VNKDKLVNSELTRLIKRGEQSAFELLFKLYHASLCNFARVYVKNYDVANEIVQETFIKIWEIRSTLDENLSLKAFLYKCVHNNCINYIKKEKTVIRLTEEFCLELNYRMKFLQQDTFDHYFETLSMEELEETARKAIDDLPDQCREVFLLSRFKGLTYQEIATHQNISINTVKTQLSRALQKIRFSLKNFLTIF